MWVDKGSELYNMSVESWLLDSHEVMYSTHNEGKCIAERFVRTLKKKIYKLMTSISRNVYIDKVRHIVEKCTFVLNNPFLNLTSKIFEVF